MSNEPLDLTAELNPFEADIDDTIELSISSHPVESKDNVKLLEVTEDGTRLNIHFYTQKINTARNIDEIIMQYRVETDVMSDDSFQLCFGFDRYVNMSRLSDELVDMINKELEL